MYFHPFKPGKPGRRILYHILRFTITHRVHRISQRRLCRCAQDNICVAHCIQEINHLIKCVDAFDGHRLNLIDNDHRIHQPVHTPYGPALIGKKRVHKLHKGGTYKRLLPIYILLCKPVFAVIFLLVIPIAIDRIFDHGRMMFQYPLILPDGLPEHFSILFCDTYIWRHINNTLCLRMPPAVLQGICQAAQGFSSPCWNRQTIDPRRILCKFSTLLL